MDEQIAVLSKLTRLIESNPVLQTKKIQKLPDAEYSEMLKEEGLDKISSTSRKTIGEFQKNEEW